MSGFRGATDCLGCGCPEGGVHADDCRFYGDYPRRQLRIDIRALARQYGIDPNFVVLEDDRLLVVGASLS